MSTDPIDVLIAQRARLQRILTSGVQEIEQPQLGRTQYRNLEEISAAIAALDAQIGAAQGVRESRTFTVAPGRGLWGSTGCCCGGGER